mgnify:CR=1 FL=1
MNLVCHCIKMSRCRHVKVSKLQFRFTSSEHYRYQPFFYICARTHDNSSRSFSCANSQRQLVCCCWCYQVFVNITITSVFLSLLLFSYCKPRLSCLMLVKLSSASKYSVAHTRFPLRDGMYSATLLHCTECCALCDQVS